MILSILVISLLNYFDIIGPKGLSIMQIISAVVWIFIGGFLIGKKVNKKGYLEGIKLGLIVVFLFILINLLGIRVNFEFKSFIFYLILVVSAMIGGIIGIGKSGGKLDSK